ncbi:hypothetical protein Hanom_Chr09g00795991 [Helianthus anomalus]
MSSSWIETPNRAHHPLLCRVIEASVGAQIEAGVSTIVPLMPPLLHSSYPNAVAPPSLLLWLRRSSPTSIAAVVSTAVVDDDD